MNPSDEEPTGLLARPGQLLIEHLNNTAVMCSEIRDKRVSIDGETDGEILGDAAFLMGFAHDLGKATGYFQGYLREKDEKKKKVLKNKDETHHSLLSSLFTYRIVADGISRSILWTIPRMDTYPYWLFWRSRGIMVTSEISGMRSCRSASRIPCRGEATA